MNGGAPGGCILGGRRRSCAVGRRSTTGILLSRAPRRACQDEPKPVAEPNSLAQFARLPVVVAAASAAGERLGGTLCSVAAAGGAEDERGGDNDAGAGVAVA